MNTQEINRILDNLMREGHLTKGQAYMKVRRMFLVRLEHAPMGSAAEDRFLKDLDLLDKIYLNR